MILDVLSILCIGASVFFFAAGVLGVLRFPDVYTRLHALTKADNLGLGWVVAGLALQHGFSMIVLKLILVWLVALLASATTGYLVARSGLRLGVQPRQGAP
jgi:multicomponent Na+:H+ antiporter subunit G